MSKEKTPVLAGAIPSFERFLTGWEKLRDAKPDLAPAINVGLAVAEEYYRKMDDTPAYIIAMCEPPFIS